MCDINTNNKLTLEEMVNRMMKENNHNSRDYCFRLIVSKYPKESHIAFNFPGEFLNSLKTKAYTNDGRNLEMDCAQIVMPKGDITCKSTINVEHQSSPLIKDKIGIIYDYKLYLIHKTNMPSNSIVITNIDPGKQEICYKTHDQIYKIKYIVITQEDISKRLSILENKIKNKDHLSIVETLNFVVIAIFIDGKNTKSIMENLANLFSQIDKMDLSLQLDIHQVLKKMIRYHFRNDEKKCKELLIMISKEIFQENYEGLSYKEVTELRMQEKDAEHKQDLEEKDLAHKQDLEEKDLAHKQALEEKDLAYKQALEEKDLAYKQALEEKDEEIEKLKLQLSNQK